VRSQRIALLTHPFACCRWYRIPTERIFLQQARTVEFRNRLGERRGISARNLQQEPGTILQIPKLRLANQPGQIKLIHVMTDHPRERLHYACVGVGLREYRQQKSVRMDFRPSGWNARKAGISQRTQLPSEPVIQLALCCPWTEAKRFRRAAVTGRRPFQQRKVGLRDAEQKCGIHLSPGRYVVVQGYANRNSSSPVLYADENTKPLKISH
jgi:hypothetical protein